MNSINFLSSSTTVRFVVDEIENVTVKNAVERVLAGKQLDRRDGLALIAQPVEELAFAADYVRSQFGDDTVDACSIVNAKAGNCAEDCGFCAQSVHFDTGIDTHGFLDPDEILAAATRAERDGAQRFGIVVAEKGVSKEQRPQEWREVLRAIRLVRDETAVHALEHGAIWIAYAPDLASEQRAAIEALVATDPHWWASP